MKTRTCLVILLAIPLVILNLLVSVGCRRTSTPPPQTPPIVTAPPPELSHVQGGATPVTQAKYFKGSIGSSLGLQMKLIRTGDQLSGSYFYQKIGKRIDLRGNVDKDGNLTLEEFDQSGKQTGLFKGLWQVKAQDGLATLVADGPGQSTVLGPPAVTVHDQRNVPGNQLGLDDRRTRA